MPRRVVHQTVSENPRVLVVLLHPSDQGIQQALKIVESLSYSGQVKPFLLVEVNAVASESTQYDTRILDGGQYEDTNLLDIIHGAGSLERVDLVSACSTSLPETGQRHLAATAATLCHSLRRLAHKTTEIFDHRVYFPNYDALTPAAPYLDGGPNSGLIIIPEDRQFDSAVAMPLHSTESQPHQWHSAIELLSITGLWTTMAGSPLENVERANPGIDVPFVRLVRSMVRTSRFAHPSVTELLGSEESLPIPVGKQAAPDPFYLVQEAARAIHPPEFKLLPLEEFTQQRHRIKGRWLLTRLFRRIGRDILDLPKTARQGIRREFEESVTSFAQTLIGGNSWVEAVWSGSTTDQPVPETPNTAEVIELIEARGRKPTLADLPPESWDHVVETTLGVIDGSEQAASIRQEAGNNTFVAIDRVALTRGDRTTITATIDELESEDETDDTDLAHPTLLGSVTRIFKAEEQRASDRCERLINDLKSFSRPEARSRSGITLTVRICFIASVVLAVIAVTTLSPIHRFLDLSEYTRALERMRLFVIATVLAAIPVTLLYIPEDSRRMQIYLVAMAAAIPGVGAYFYFEAPALLKSTISEGTFLDRLAAFIIVAGIIVSSIAALVRPNQAAGTALRDTARKLTGATVLVYGVGMMIAGLNLPRARTEWLEDRQTNLLFIVLIIAIAVFLASATASSIAHVRDEYHLNQWQGHFQWLVDNTTKAVDDLKIVSALTVHWFGTATVLARLINRPYGEPPNDTGSTTIRPDPKPEILKIRSLNLDLTDKGREAFLDRASPMLTSPGWLTGQYRRITHAFVAEGRGRYGARDADNTSRPEACAYPVDMERALARQARGRRWPFAYQVYDGKFDSILRQPAEAELAQALLDTFLDDPSSCELESGADVNETLSSAFQEILPEAEPDFPLGVLGDNAAGIAASPDFRYQVWWPKQIPLPDRTSAIPVSNNDHYSVGSSVIFQAVRVDISEPVPVTGLITQLTPEWSSTDFSQEPRPGWPDEPLL
jgi:hypothetical protein